MATEKNDKIILTLKAEIEKKKEQLKKVSKFSPITNCSLELDGVRFNLNAISLEQLYQIMVKVNTYKLSAEDLGIEKETKFSGYILEDWLTDLKSRLSILGMKEEETKLKKMEQRLHELLSTDKKVELEIDAIMKDLNGE